MVDYEIYRYVDDYFVFSSDPSVEDLIKGHLGAYLREVKLSLSSEKSTTFERPIITPLTIAKNRVSEVLDGRISVREKYVEDPSDPTKEIKHFNFSVQSRYMIVDFKSVIYETEVSYKDILNYTLAAIERRTESFFSNYQRNHPELRDPRELVRALIGLLDFSFFVYAASPRVNFTVRLTRIVATIVDGLHGVKLDQDLKEQVFKFIFDNIHRQVKGTPIDRFHEVETLYLLLAVSKLGRSYFLPEDVLARFLGIARDGSGTFVRHRRLSYFSISVCLILIRNRKKYGDLKRFIEDEILRKFRERSAYVRSDAELVIAFMDLQCCPYVSRSVKMTLATHYQFSVHDLPFLSSVSGYWFTNWGDFDLSVELDKKRAREVY